MVAYTGKRTYTSEEAMKFLERQEWGLLILDGTEIKTFRAMGYLRDLASKKCY